MSASHLVLVTAKYVSQQAKQPKLELVPNRLRKRRKAPLSQLMVAFVADIICLSDGKHLTRRMLNEQVSRGVLDGTGLTSRLHRLIYTHSILSEHNEPWHYKYLVTTENVPQSVWNEIAVRTSRAQFSKFFTFDPLVSGVEHARTLDHATRLLTTAQKAALAAHLTANLAK